MAPDDDSTFARGRRIDRYEIRAPIGEGGMGAVYRAFDTKLGRTVALKTVVARRRTALSEEMRGRFTREALAASKVSHRNVVQVLDYGFADDGSPYIVMEYLRGRDLGARLRDSEAPLAVDEVADVMLGVCAALQACHQAGIVHRDLKPANIFLADTDTGAEVKVLDFGVSKAPLAGDLTEEGQILGTPQYLSPEQVEGKTVPESDQYALGMVLYVCLTKHMPYEEHQSLSLLRAIELGKFQPPRAHRPDLPVALEEVILRTLRLSPAQRYPSVHALGRALLPFASTRGRTQWRDYYTQTPAARPKESTLGLPLGAPGTPGTRKASPPPPATPSASPRAPATPNASPPPAMALASTDSVSGELPPRVGTSASGLGPQAQVSTKLEQPAPSAGTEGSLLDVAGESTAGESRVPRSGARRALVGLLAGVGIAGGALFFYSYTRTRPDRPLLGAAAERTDRQRPPPVAPASPAAAVVVPPQAPEPTAPPAAVPAPPRTPDTATKLPEAMKPPAPAAAAPSPAPRAPSEPGATKPPAPAAAAPSPAPRAPSARAHKHARREKPKSSVEAAPDGVPIMP
jgi:serine/threonine-protein kinase